MFIVIIVIVVLALVDWCLVRLNALNKPCNGFICIHEFNCVHAENDCETCCKRACRNCLFKCKSGQQ